MRWASVMMDKVGTTLEVDRAEGLSRDLEAAKGSSREVAPTYRVAQRCMASTEDNSGWKGREEARKDTRVGVQSSKEEEGRKELWGVQRRREQEW